MNTKMRRWLPIALCCLPGAAIAAIVIGIAAGGSVFGASFGGPLGLGLIALAMLACPVSMGLIMMRRGSNQKSAPNSSHAMADCCAPGEAPTPAAVDSAAERLAALREHRQALERELAELTQTR